MTPDRSAPPAASRASATSLPERNGAAHKRDWAALGAQIAAWGKAIGFEAVGVSDVHLADAETHLLNWLAAGRHGEMDYMARHGASRARPADLVPGTVRVITARMDYGTDAARDAGDADCLESELAAPRRDVVRERVVVARRGRGRVHCFSHG